METQLINSYAVVVYVHGPLAAFVDGLRGELTPGCQHRAHVTLLPPRELSVERGQAIEECGQILSRFHPFAVEIGGVSVFEDTGVIKLSITEGSSELHTLHNILNTGPFAQDENFEYTPHITLCMGHAPENTAEFAAHARDLWTKFGGKARIWVDTATLVQQRADGSWIDHAELPIGQPEYQPAMRSC